MKLNRDTLANRIMPVVLLLVALTVLLIALVMNALGTTSAPEPTPTPSMALIVYA